MSLTTYPDVDQRSDAWHDLRRGIVTASIVGKLVTPRTVKVASNDDSRRVVAQLAAERITGWSDESRYLSDDMVRGIEHEPIAREKYAEVNGVTVTECGFMVLERDGWQLGYSPDGLVGDDGLIEVKCPRAKTHLSTIVADSVPLGYMAQCQAALLVSGRDWIDFVSFCGGMPLFTKRVEPNPLWQAAITEAVANTERAIEALTSDYLSAVVGLPATERVDPDTVELKLA